MEKLLTLAVEQFGYDRRYTICFNNSEPVITVSEYDNTQIATVDKSGITRH